MTTGLVLLRVTLGVSLAAHGAQRLFGWCGGGGLKGTGAGLVAIGCVQVAVMPRAALRLAQRRPPATMR